MQAAVKPGFFGYLDHDPYTWTSFPQTRFSITGSSGSERPGPGAVWLPDSRHGMVTDRREVGAAFLLTVDWNLRGFHIEHHALGIDRDVNLGAQSARRSRILNGSMLERFDTGVSAESRGDVRPGSETERLTLPPKTSPVLMLGFSV